MFLNPTHFNNLYAMAINLFILILNNYFILRIYGDTLTDERSKDFSIHGLSSPHLVGSEFLKF